MARRLLAAVVLLLAAASGERIRPHLPARDGAAAAAAVRAGGDAPPRRRASGIFSSLALFLAAAGAPHAQAQEEEAPARLDLTVANFDANGDGLVSRDEFLGKAVQAMEEEDSSDERRELTLKFWDRLFDAAEMDGDGHLGDREMEYAGVLLTNAAIREMRAHIENLFGIDGLHALANGELVDEAEVAEDVTSAENKADDSEDSAARETSEKSDQSEESQDVEESGEKGTSEEKEEAEEGEPRGAEEFDIFGTREFQQLLEEADENGNGVICKAEYVKAMQRSCQLSWGLGEWLDDPAVAAWLDELFEKADVNGDGVLTAKEVQYVAYLAERDIKAGRFEDRHVADLLLSQFDLDGDGKVAKEEIAKVSKEELARLKASTAAKQSSEETAEDASDEGEKDKPPRPPQPPGHPPPEHVLAADAPGRTDDALPQEAAGDAQPAEGAEAKEEDQDDVEVPVVFQRVAVHFGECDADGDETLDRAEVLELATRLVKDRLNDEL